MMTERMDERKNDMYFRAKARGAPSAECVINYMVWKQQEHIIEKSLDTLIASMKASSEFGKDIQHEQIKFSSNRTKLFDSLKNTLYDIADELRFVKSTIQNISDIDIDKYRSKLESLWKKMDKFNKSNILETLMKEQSQIDSELSEFNDQLYKYDRHKTDVYKHAMCQSRSVKSSDSHMEYKDVKNLNSFVAKTGYTQHWSDEDHLLFLKLRQRCKTVPALVTALQSKCPDLSTECIIEHEAWYKIYLEMRQKQKELINEWRKKKERQKRETSSEDSSEMMENQNTRKLIEMPSNSHERSIRVEITRKVKSNNERDQMKKEMIRQWKAERELQRLNEEEEIKAQMKMKQLEQESQRQARALKMKMELIEYKKQKVMEAERALNDHIRQYECKPKNTWKSFQQFRQQDERFVQKRKFLLQRKYMTNNRNHASTNYVQKHQKRFPMNPDKWNFLKSTQGWEQKCRFFNPLQKQTPKLMYIKDLPNV